MSAAAATAELLPDAGAAAAAPGEFFRSPEYLAAEGVTHTLIIGPAAVPVIVRPIPGTDLQDAISPYGYPGAAVTTGPATAQGTPLEPAAVDFSTTGLVSAFIRGAIGTHPLLAGANHRADVQICDPALEPGVRKRVREQIRRNLRRGWQIERIPAPDSTPAQRQGFERAYRQTMERTGATARYFFSDEWFDGVFASSAAVLVTASHEGGDPTAGAIEVKSDGMLHYFLGGTAEEALGDSPMKNLFWAMIEASNEQGLPLHLGAGLEPGDSLERFKAGFANRTEPFHTYEVICDPAAYERLSDSMQAPAAGFFPAYRAGG